MKTFSDAQHLSFVQSQTAAIERMVYMEQYAGIQYPGLVTIDSSAPEGTDQILHYSEDAVGEVRFISEMGTDIPLVDVSRAQYSVRVAGLSIGYHWTYWQVQQAMLLGRSLSAEKAMAARRIMEERIDKIFLNGESELGWDGILNNSNIPRYAAPSNEDGDNTTWEQKSALEIVDNVLKAVADVYTTQTNTVILANTVLLPPSSFALLNRTPIGNSASMNCMEFIMRNNQYTSSGGSGFMIRTLRSLETAGDSTGVDSSKRMIVYRNEPAVLKMHMPMPIRFFPVERKGFHYVVAGAFRCGGLEIRQPNAMSYVDGI